MFSLIRKRLGIPGIIAVIALVFAMAGGAWAAKGGVVIKKLSQIAPRVQKQLKGKAGPQGPAGPQGLSGGAGAKGDKGDKGDSGSNGAAGKSVVTTPIAEGEVACEGFGGTEAEVEGSGEPEEVCNGETGFTETLPSEKTETGTWAAVVSGEAFAPVSFSIPLEAVIPAANVHKTGDVGFASSCEGTAADPQADPGHLCVYTGFLDLVAPATTLVGIFPATGPPAVEGAAISGAFVYLAGGEGGGGTFAVTAP